MSYTKHTWANGDVITATKLNEMESGIDEASSGGGSSELLIINATENDDGTVLDKTWQEIYDAIYEDNKICYIYLHSVSGETTVDRINIVIEVSSMITTGTYPSSQYDVMVKDAAYSVNSADDYPFIPWD